MPVAGGAFDEWRGRLVRADLSYVGVSVCASDPQAESELTIAFDRTPGYPYGGQIQRLGAPFRMIWDLLRATYERHGLVLVLGAGVSVGSGLPTWSGLLERIARWEGEGGETRFGDLRDEGVSLPVIASILEERCRAGDATDTEAARLEFVRRIRSSLYHDFPFFPAGVTRANRQDLVEHVRSTNPTLRAVAALCAVEAHGGAGYVANNRIRAVVTFNLDAVLQEYVHARYGGPLLRTIERASAQAIPGRINIYHMHGFLRFDAKAGNRAKEAPDAVVITEQDYFEFFNDPTSLFNYTFLYLLRESPCLFIGLSMQDGNVRRLLHFSKQERVRGFLNEGVAPEKARRNARRHFAILKRHDASELDRAVEESLLPLGTYVLWIDDFAEIRPRLQELYESAGGDWTRIF